MALIRVTASLMLMRKRQETTMDDVGSTVLCTVLGSFVAARVARGRHGENLSISIHDNGERGFGILVF